MQVIGIIDDDPFIVKILIKILSETEFKVIVINENGDIGASIDQNGVDLILLDLNLKNHCGFEIARQLRIRSDLGLIMLTGSKDQLDKLVGLEIGLDDYIVKPFDNRELKARCRNVLRRIASFKAQENVKKQSVSNVNIGSESVELTPYGFKLDDNYFNLITNEGEKIKLTTYEFRLLKLFLNNKEIVSRQIISQGIYNRDWSPYERSVDVLISKLRKKLNQKNSGIEIVTVRGEGYKLVQSN